MTFVITITLQTRDSVTVCYINWRSHFSPRLSWLQKLSSLILWFFSFVKGYVYVIQHKANYLLITFVNIIRVAECFWLLSVWVFRLYDIFGYKCEYLMCLVICVYYYYLLLLLLLLLLKMSSELNQMYAVQVAPSGERSQGRGRYGVVCRGNPVWSIPECLELKFHERRYTSTLTFTYLTTTAAATTFVWFMFNWPTFPNLL